MFCKNCGKEIDDKAVVCVNCGAAVQGNSVEDKVSVGLCILSFIIPIFGIIYWPVKNKETPKRAKACGITAIVSWVLGIIMNLALSGMMY